MDLRQLLVLAVLAMVALGALRVVRVHLGRTPLPDGRGRRLFQIAFVVVPPLVVGALIQPTGPAGPLRGVSSLILYVPIVAALTLVMWSASLVIGEVTRSRSGSLARLALAGTEDDPARGIPSDPPITPQLAQAVAVVDRANSAFPRGPAFPAEVDRAAFRADWDTLEDACRTLERDIVVERRLAIGVAAKAEATATDARSRLDTLRRIASQNGQAWAQDGSSVDGFVIAR